VKRALALGLLSRAAALEIAALGDWEPRTCVRDDACANTKAGLYPRNASALLLANLETVRVVGDPAAVDGRLGVALWYELGCGVDAYGARLQALADRVTCAGPASTPAAAAVLTEQRPRRRPPGCS